MGSLINEDEDDEGRETTLVLLCNQSVMQSERQTRPNSKAGLERQTSKPCWPDRCKPISGPRTRDGGAAAARPDSAQVVLVVPLVPMPVPLVRREVVSSPYGTLRILISTPGRYRLVVSSCRACSRSDVV